MLRSWEGRTGALLLLGGAQDLPKGAGSQKRPGVGDPERFYSRSRELEKTEALL